MKVWKSRLGFNVKFWHLFCFSHGDYQFYHNKIRTRHPQWDHRAGLLSFLSMEPQSSSTQARPFPRNHYMNITWCLFKFPHLICLLSSCLLPSASVCQSNTVGGAWTPLPICASGSLAPWLPDDAKLFLFSKSSSFHRLITWYYFWLLIKKTDEVRFSFLRLIDWPSHC